MKLFELYLMALALLAGRAAADNQEYYSGEFIIPVPPSGRGESGPSIKTRANSGPFCPSVLKENLWAVALSERREGKREKENFFLLGRTVFSNLVWPEAKIRSKVSAFMGASDKIANAVAF